MDHVPPRSMFPEKLPNNINLVTAPACQDCHDSNKRDDTTIRNLLISTQDTEKHPAIIGELAGKRDRSFARSLKRGETDFRQLLGMMKLVDVKSTGGIYLGKDWAFDFDNPVINRFVERLGRALLSYEFGQQHFGGSFGWRMNVEMPSLVYKGIQRSGRMRRICDVFAYGVTPLKDDAPAWVVANFYGNTEFLIRVGKIPNKPLE